MNFWSPRKRFYDVLPALIVAMVDLAQGRDSGVCRCRAEHLVSKLPQSLVDAASRRGPIAVREWISTADCRLPEDEPDVTPEEYAAYKKEREQASLCWLRRLEGSEGE